MKTFNVTQQFLEDVRAALVYTPSEEMRQRLVVETCKALGAPITVDDVCGQPPGTFRAYVANESAVAALEDILKWEGMRLTSRRRVAAQVAIARARGES